MIKNSYLYIYSIVFSILLLISGCEMGVDTDVQSGDERVYINPNSAGDDGAPFSGGVMANNTLYISGAIGMVDGEVPDNPTDEAKAVLDSIKGTLEDAGLTMDDLAWVQIFCSDVSHYGAFNEVYRTYFSAEFPARAFVGSGKLLFDARFEVNAIAVSN